MTDQPEDSGQTVLDVADRKMLAEIKANVLGTARAELRIGRFRVLERLGEGSMGIVFAAFDEQLQRRVAIKLLHQDVGASEGERKARLSREAQILAQLEHPNIVQVYEAGEHDGQLFMAMEIVEGRALDELQRTRPPGEWKTLLPLYVAAGHGLAAAHAKGVVHRDFKPHNVLVDANGRVRVVDFGLARESVGAEEPLTAEIPLTHQGAIERPRLDHLTGSGVVPGTPAYMAPELFDGQPASAASDQFSFCVALYEAVCGRRPFEGARVQDIVAAATRGQILPPPADRPVPGWLLEVLTRGLSARPEARFESMDALLEELERDRLRRWKQAGMMVTVAMVIGGTWWLRGHSDPAIDVRGLLRGPDVVEEQRRDTCRADAQRLEQRWRDAKPRLSRRESEQEDASEWATVLDADAERFFETWGRSCVVDIDASAQQCRAEAEQELEAVIEQGTDHPLPTDTLHELSVWLELCVEDAPSESPGSIGLDAPAGKALIAAQAAELTGDLDAALRYVDQAVDHAAEANDLLTWARALLCHGAILERRGEIDRARAVLNEAMIYALSAHADVLAIDVALESAEVEILHSGTVDLADRSLRVARWLLDKPSMPQLPLRRARLLEKQGNAKLNLERRCVDGLDSFLKARAIREDAIVERRREGASTKLLERLTADAQLNIANTKYFALTGLWEGCVLPDVSESGVLEEYQQARARFSAAVGNERHLGLAEYEFSLGAALLEAGRHAEAIEHFENVREIHGAHHGFQSIPVGEDHLALAEAHRRAGDISRALDDARKNLEIRQMHSGEDGQRPALAEAHAALGVIAQEAGKLDLARKALLDSIDLHTTPSSAELTITEQEQLRLSYVNLALVEWDRGERAASQRAIERAREVQDALRERDGTSLEDIAPQRVAEARVLLEQGRAREALARLEGAEELPDVSPTILRSIDELRKRAGASK